MSSIAVAESPAQHPQIATRDLIAGWKSTNWMLVLSFACLAAVISPPGSGPIEHPPAVVIDDVWCNHIVTVDSRGFTDKVLDCRTLAEWRAGTRHTPSGSVVLAEAH